MPVGPNLYTEGKRILAASTEMDHPYGKIHPCATCQVTPEWYVPCPRCGVHMCSPCQLHDWYCPECLPFVEKVLIENKQYYSWRGWFAQLRADQKKG